MYHSSTGEFLCGHVDNSQSGSRTWTSLMRLTTYVSVVGTTKIHPKFSLLILVQIHLVMTCKDWQECDKIKTYSRSISNQQNSSNIMRSHLASIEGQLVFGQLFNNKIIMHVSFLLCPSSGSGWISWML